MNTTKKLFDIDILRTLSIIGVVFFHAYQMMYANHFQSIANVYRTTYFNFLEILSSFRMPLLIFSSGFLYSYLLGRGKYKDTPRYVYHKFKRLIIPYFVFATIYSLVFMHDLDIATIIKGNLAHLWFITMLFWCFCAIRLFSFGTTNNQQLLYECGVLVVSFLLMFCPWELPKFIGIHYFPKWFFWFYPLVSGKNE